MSTEATRPAATRETNGRGDGTPARTVREAFFDVLRARAMRRIFSNPGSTEVPLLAGLPDDLEFVLALHEGSVVGMATGAAIASGQPAFALLHTTAGLGNAVSAIATARVNRAPVVIVVGQQDRRHLPPEAVPAGPLEGLGGGVPVWVNLPARAQDVPGAVSRAWHEATTGRGPAIVIVPMDDWLAPAAVDEDVPAAERVVRAAAADPAAVAELAALLADARAPAIVVGAGADDPDTWAGLATIAERLGAPVWQEAFGARAGFPQDHPRFAGQLAADRPRLRGALSGHDVVLAVGAPVFRQYPFMPGPLVEPGTRVAVVTDDPAEAHRSPAELAVLAPPAAVCRALAELVEARPGAADAPPARERPPAPPPPPPAGGPPRGSAGRPPGPAPAPPAGGPPPAPPPPGPGEPLRAGHVFAALADRLAPDAVVVEESPSSRPELEMRLPAR